MEDQKRKTLPKRGEISDQYKWDLTKIFVDDNAWEAAFAEVKNEMTELSKFQGTLGDSAEQLLKALKLRDQISEKLGKVYVYSHLKHDEDTTNSTYKGFYDRAVSLYIQFSSITAFYVPEILSIPEEKLQQFIQSNAELQVYKVYLDDLNRQREHTLSAAEEQILAQAGELATAPEDIFGMLNNADIKFPHIIDENGEEVELTKGRFIQFLESKDRRVRKDAFNALYDTYKKYKNTIAAALSAQVKKDIFFAKVRKFNSALEASLDQDNVSVKVYNNLVDTVNQNLNLLHRYVSLRKRLLGLDELHMYDLYVSMIADMDMKIPYEKAVDTVVQALAPLGKEYVDAMKDGIHSGWIDVYENEGKRSGAYSSGTYGTDPYILLNYQDTLDNMFTLAHELGHSMHSYYSRKTQPYIYSDYTIFVAEVASTLNEALLTHYLINNTNDKKEKMYLINHHLEGFRTTVYRQTMFAEFEKWIHEQVEAGNALNHENLSEAYYQLNKKYYGDDIVVDDDIRYEWSRIPHFYYNFYVYKYATGFSAATSLAQQILEEGTPAVERYLQFLKSGCSKYPLDLLKDAGVDMTTSVPIQKALDVFKSLLDQMEQLLEEQDQ